MTNNSLPYNNTSQLPTAELSIIVLLDNYMVRWTLSLLVSSSIGSRILDNVKCPVVEREYGWLPLEYRERQQMGRQCWTLFSFFRSEDRQPPRTLKQMLLLIYFMLCILYIYVRFKPPDCPHIYLWKILLLTYYRVSGNFSCLGIGSSRLDDDDFFPMLEISRPWWWCVRVLFSLIYKKALNSVCNTTSRHVLFMPHNWPVIVKARQLDCGWIMPYSLKSTALRPANQRTPRRRSRASAEPMMWVPCPGSPVCSGKPRTRDVCFL